METMQKKSAHPKTIRIPEDLMAEALEIAKKEAKNRFTMPNTSKVFIRWMRKGKEMENSTCH